MTTRAALRCPSRWMPWALVAGILGSGLLMAPVMLAPIAADDRYQHLLQASKYANPLDMAVRTWAEMEATMAMNGRFAPIDYIIQRAANMWITDTSVAMGLDTYVVQGALKVFMLVVAVVAFWWFLRQLRVRDHTGQVVAPSARLVSLAVLTVAVLMVCGGQSQYLYRSAWVAYPVLTYPAVPFVLAGLALLLGITNLLGRSGRWWPTVALTIPLAAFFVLQYELYWTVAPLAVLMLLLHTPCADVTRGRRVKALVGGTFLAAFIAIMVPVRMALARACEIAQCPGNTSIAVGRKLVRSWAMNLVSAIPGSGVGVGWYQARAVDADSPAFLPLAAWGLAFAVMLILGYWTLLRHLQRVSSAALRPVAQTTPVPAPERFGKLHGDRAVAVILVLIGGAWALGSALIMSLSPMAQRVVQWPGQPFRATVAIWFSFSMVLVGLAVWWAPWRSVSRKATLRTWWPVMAVALMAGLLAHPTNVRADHTERHRPFERVTDQIHSHVVFHDASPQGDSIRCALLDEMYSIERTEEAEKNRITLGANTASRHYWGVPFCERRQK